MRNTLFWRNRVFGVKVHLPPPIATNPDCRDVGFSRHCPLAASWAFRGVIHDGGAVMSKENDPGIDNLNGSEGAMLVELFYKAEHLVLIPYFCLNVRKVGHKDS